MLLAQAKSNLRFKEIHLFSETRVFKIKRNLLLKDFVINAHINFFNLKICKQNTFQMVWMECEIEKLQFFLLFRWVKKLFFKHFCISDDEF